MDATRLFFHDPSVPAHVLSPVVVRPRQPGYLDAEGVRWEDPRLNAGSALLASKGVVLGSILRGMRQIQGRVWQAFMDGLLDRTVLTVALPLYHPRPGGRIDGTRQFFQMSAMAWGKGDPRWVRELQRVTDMHVDRGVVDPQTMTVKPELMRSFTWIAGSMAWRMQSAFPSWLHAAPRLHWLHVAGELGLTHAPATEDDFQRFIELHRRQIRSERVEADNADVLQRRASEIANRILPRILELSGTTREAFAAQFDNGEDRKWLGL